MAEPVAGRVPTAPGASSLRSPEPQSVSAHTGDAPSRDTNLLGKRWAELEIKAVFETSDDEEEDAFHLGMRDGFSEAIQLMDLMTGGDGEYRYCTNHDPERHCPTPYEMAARIIARFRAPDPASHEAGKREGIEAAAKVAEAAAAQYTTGDGVFGRVVDPNVAAGAAVLNIATAIRNLLKDTD